MSDRGRPVTTRRDPRRPLRDRIGVIFGTVLGLIAAGFLVVVALAGGAGGTGVLVVVVVGVVLIYFGGRLHGLNGRS
ncbi:MAG: hypothetical protein ACYCST_07505 [Acidimicrobiales bacterium]